MKKLLPVITLLIFLLTACSGWTIEIPNIPSPFPSVTPRIFTPTPLVVTTTPSPTPDFATATLTESPTETTTPTETETPTPSEPGDLTVEVLGCNTSIDITHGMGEVTNAFVLIKNTTGQDLPNLCATLFALDEGRAHPDKTVCLPILENNYQVSLKLTVDSTYQEETPIQIDITSNNALFSRVGESACRNIGLFAPAPDSLSTPMPVP